MDGVVISRSPGPERSISSLFNFPIVQYFFVVCSRCLNVCVSMYVCVCVCVYMRDKSIKSSVCWRRRICSILEAIRTPSDARALHLLVPAPLQSFFRRIASVPPASQSLFFVLARRFFAFARRLSSLDSAMRLSYACCSHS